MNFAELGLSPELLEAIDKLGFETPTPVQEAVIPVLLESNRDLVALAQTGTGKTAAYGLPLLQLLDLSRSVPQVLVLCPTRELCMQIARDLEGFACGLPRTRVLAVYGGAAIMPQVNSLSRGVHVVVATPGRLLDLLRRGSIDLAQVTRLVLDEADEMLSMGFEEDLEAILKGVPETAQTLLFSATMPAQVAKIAARYMNSPAEITMGQRNAGSEGISHEYYVVPARERYSALRRIVDLYPDMYGIVFCRTRLETQEIADQLRLDGYDAEPLHGDLSQQQRDHVMKKFRDRRVRILVATDVAARGLDVTDLSHVVNFNLPDELIAYTHRTGRTGRAGKEGIAVSIIHMREQFKIEQIQRLIGKKLKRRPVPTGTEICRARLASLARQVMTLRLEDSLVDEHFEELCTLLDDLPKAEIIRRFASMSLRGMLEFYRNAPDLNRDMAQKRDSRPPNRWPGAEPQGLRAAGVLESKVEMVMNVGRTNGLTPALLLVLVNAADRGRRVTVGRIRISDMQAYFEVPEEQAQRLLDGFARGHVNIHGRQVGISRTGVVRKVKPHKFGRGQGGPKRRR